MIFIKDIYSQEYYEIIEKAKTRAITRKTANEILGYSEGHHIIPKSFFISNRNKNNPGWIEGDANHLDNYAFLSAQEHYRVHQLLVKMTLIDEKYRYQAYKNMVYSLIKMSGKGNHAKYNITEEQYYNSKKELAEIKRKELSGSKRAPFTDEHKKKIALARTGTKRSEETRLKMKQNRTGKKRKPHSDETKKKISEANKGKIPSEETRKIWSEKRKGKTSGNKGKKYKVPNYPKNRKSAPPRSPETIEKMREARRNWHKRNACAINNIEETTI